ncbi:MAG: divergent polysaccharide deacetylase family protein [Desulfuromonadaceae bacterium]|nr:divergent polysaccharide deacetylase family protein [Desulfuromonadaceae bacterium]
MATKKPATTHKKKPSKKKPPVKKQPSVTAGGRFVSGMILIGIVLLAGLVLWVRQPVQDYDERPAPRTIEDVIPAPVAPENSPAELQVALELILWDLGIDLRSPRISDRQGIKTFTLEAPFPDQEQLRALSVAVKHLAETFRVASDKVKRRIDLYDGDALRYALEFSASTSTAKVRPRIALIVDDLGRDVRIVRRLLALETDLSFSILPGETYAQRVAELAHGQNREVLIHLPMEPHGYPEKNPGADALMVGMTAEGLRTRMDKFVAQVPYAVGGNNHMGSRFTEDREGMRTVVDYLRDKNIFFIDSLTSHNSLAMETARGARVPTAVRDVFLDNVPEVDAIVRELRKLVEVAKRRGRAIGICHPYPETLAALEQEIPLLQSSDLQFVPVSALLLR